MCVVLWMINIFHQLIMFYPLLSSQTSVFKRFLLHLLTICPTLFITAPPSLPPLLLNSSLPSPSLHHPPSSPLLPHPSLLPFLTFYCCCMVISIFDCSLCVCPSVQFWCSQLCSTHTRGGKSSRSVCLYSRRLTWR